MAHWIHLKQKCIFIQLEKKKKEKQKQNKTEENKINKTKKPTNNVVTDWEIHLTVMCDGEH